MADAKWYVQLNGQVHGPLTAVRLKDLVARGSITPQTPVSGDGRTWVAAGKIRGLTFAASSPPPLPSCSNSQPDAAEPVPGQTATSAAKPATLKQAMPVGRGDAVRGPTTGGERSPIPDTESGFDASWLTESQRSGITSKKRKHKSGWMVPAIVAGGVGVVLVVIGLVAMTGEGQHGASRASQGDRAKKSANNQRSAEVSGGTSKAPGASSVSNGPDYFTASSSRATASSQVTVVDLGAELRAAGIMPQPGDFHDSKIQRYLRFGDGQRSEEVRRKPKLAATIEEQVNTPQRQERIRSCVYGLFNLPIHLPVRRNRITEDQFWIRCQIPLRLFKPVLEASSSSSCDLSINRVPFLQPFFLKTDGTLMSCQSAAIEAEVRRRGGVIYYPESIHCCNLVLKVPWEPNKRVALIKNLKEYQVDVVLEGLKYDETYQWGYYRADSLGDSWDCDELLESSASGLTSW